MLQNLIKRAPESYAEEFQVQWARFGSQVKIVQLGLGGAKADEEQLKEVTNFVCQASRFLSLYLREWVPGGARAR
jgi:protein SDA1